jgi:hypothetical protein
MASDVGSRVAARDESGKAGAKGWHREGTQISMEMTCVYGEIAVQNISV